MSVHVRRDWSRHIDQVLRSQHYNRLAEGLSGEPLDDALVHITADIMHICKRQGIAWETLLDRSQAQFEEEEVARPAFAQPRQSDQARQSETAGAGAAL